MAQLEMLIMSNIQGEIRRLVFSNTTWLPNHKTCENNSPISLKTKIRIAVKAWIVLQKISTKGKLAGQYGRDLPSINNTWDDIMICSWTYLVWNLEVSDLGPNQAIKAIDFRYLNLNDLNMPILVHCEWLFHCRLSYSSASLILQRFVGGMQYTNTTCDILHTNTTWLEWVINLGFMKLSHWFMSVLLCIMLQWCICFGYT